MSLILSKVDDFRMNRDKAIVFGNFFFFFNNLIKQLLTYLHLHLQLQLLTYNNSKKKKNSRAITVFFFQKVTNRKYQY